MDETSSFPVPINSHLRFFICITWAFGKMPSHTAASSAPETATHLAGTQGSLHIALGLCHLHKLGGKAPLGEARRGGKNQISGISALLCLKQMSG